MKKDNRSRIRQTLIDAIVVVLFIMAMDLGWQMFQDKVCPPQFDLSKLFEPPKQQNPFGI